ncbi:MAG: BlaI/MecI/CopY family transcriptional regulator [Chloroflexia bacterium]
MSEIRMRLHFDPRQRGLGQVLGPLEAEVMWLVWQQGQATVRQVHRLLSRKRELAYTTVMTTMARLAEKGFLRRTRRGMAYLYRPTMTREEFDRWVVRSVLSGLLETFGRETVEYLVEYLSRERPEGLEYLRHVLARQAA